MVTAAMKLRHLLLGKKVMTNLDSIFKSRDITLATKVRLVKAMVFPVIMYGCESWPVKKAEHQRIDAFELWCWRRLLLFGHLVMSDSSRPHGLQHTRLPLSLGVGSNSCPLVASLVAQTIGSLPAMQETRVWFLGQEDPIEVNDNPLQYSCLENSMDRPWSHKE